MAIDLSAIREGIATNIRTVAGNLRVIPYYSDSVNIGVDGALEIGPTPGEGQTITEKITGGLFWYWMTATVYLACSDEKVAQARMDAYLSVGGERSVWTAIETDRTAGGTVALLTVDRQLSYGLIQRQSDRLLMAAWNFRVKAQV